MAHEYEKGSYKVRIEQQTFETNPKNGQPILRLDFTVLAKAGVDGKFVTVTEGRRNASLFLTPPKPGKQVGGIHMAAKTISHFAPSWDGDFSKLEPSVPGHFSLVGCVAEAINEGKESPDSKYDRWTMKVPLDGFEPRKSDPTAAMKAAALFKQYGSTTNAPAKTEANQAQYDEVPF